METVELKTHPRELAAFSVAEKDEKILGIYAIVKKEPAGLETIIGGLHSSNVTIKHVNISEAKGSDTWIVSAVLDISKSLHGADGLEAFLKRLDCVKQLIISESKSVIHQTSLFPIMNKNDRVIFQTVKHQQYIRDQLERILTPSGLSVIFYNMGLEAGKATHKMFCQEFQADLLSVKQRMDLLRDHIIAGGMGIIDFGDLNLENHSGLVRVFDDFECEGVSKKSPVCHSIKGILAGFLASEWSTDKVKVVELKCRAIGDPHCEFGVAIDEQ